MFADRSSRVGEAPGQTWSESGARRLRLWAPLVSSILLSGCVSFASVKQTAGVGAKLAAYEGAFDLAPALCAAAGASDESCRALQGDSDNWHKVNRALVGYAAALGAMADDSKDVSDKTDIAALLGAASKLSAWTTTNISTSVQSGASRGVDALITTITDQYRRDKLKQAIKANNGHVQAIAALIDKNIEVLGDLDKSLLKSSTQVTRAPAEPGPITTGVHISMGIAAIVTNGDLSTLANYKKAVDAFAKAHDDLFKDIDNVGDFKNDAAVLGEIARDVGGIVNGVAAAVPVKTNP